jgi:ATP-dependent Clp protease ATP-binding subunit ClpC
MLEQCNERRFQEILGFNSLAVAPPGFFAKCTCKAIQAIQIAKAEASRLDWDVVDTEQLLLGLLAVEESLAGRLLKLAGIDLHNTRLQIEKRIGRGIGLSEPVYFTFDLKQALRAAFEASEQRGHDYICTEHLLLGILQSQRGGADWILEALGVDLSRLRRKVETIVL